MTTPRQGEFEQTPLPRLLLDLQRTRFCGSLQIVKDHVEKRFLLHDGTPVQAESNLASESLGAQMLNDGAIDRDEYSRVVEYGKQHDSQDGKALLDLGLIDAKELFIALKAQVRARLLECFGWSRGAFRLDATEAPSEDARPFRVDLTGLLQQGIEIHWSADRVLADLGNSMNQYPSPSRVFVRIAAQLCRDDATDALLERFDGTRSLWQALEIAITPRTLATAWVLDACGALSYSDTPKGAPPDSFEIVFDTAAAERVDPVPAAPAAHPPMSPTPGDGQRTTELQREIDSRFENLAELNFYALLGLDADADAASIRRAYLDAAKTYHPDALARSGIAAETRDRASRVFARISKAYGVISDESRRQEYDRSRSIDDTGLDANRLATAENLYRKAEILLRQGNFSGALEFLKPCVDLWPEEAEYQSALGWVLYKKMPSEPEPALEHLVLARELDSNDEVVQFRIGLVRRALNG